MDTSDKRESESWSEYWQRKHDERHGPACDIPGCMFGRAAQPGRIELLPESLRVPEQVPDGKRLSRVHRTETGEVCACEAGSSAHGRPFSRVIEDAIDKAEPAAEWLRTNPPGARLPEHFDPEPEKEWWEE
jgi:hypothetical protein